MSDIRYRSKLPPGWTVDGRREILEHDGTEYPGEFIVCPVCRGRGSYVNPAVDEHGISQDEFDEDPDFEESYFSGVYDKVCHACGGTRVELVPATQAGLEAWDASWQAEREFREEYEAERRAGA